MMEKLKILRMNEKVHIIFQHEPGENLHLILSYDEAKQVARRLLKEANGSNKENENKLPSGIRMRGSKFLSEIKVDRKTKYLGSFGTLDEATQAQVNYRIENNIPEPIRGRPWNK